VDFKIMAGATTSAKKKAPALSATKKPGQTMLNFFAPKPKATPKAKDELQVQTPAAKKQDAVTTPETEETVSSTDSSHETEAPMVVVKALPKSPVITTKPKSVSSSRAPSAASSAPVKVIGKKRRVIVEDSDEDDDKDDDKKDTASHKNNKISSTKKASSPSPRKAAKTNDNSKADKMEIVKETNNKNKMDIDKENKTKQEEKEKPKDSTTNKPPSSKPAAKDSSTKTKSAAAVAAAAKKTTSTPSTKKTPSPKPVEKATTSTSAAKTTTSAPISSKPKTTTTGLSGGWGFLNGNMNQVMKDQAQKKRKSTGGTGVKSGNKDNATSSANGETRKIIKDVYNAGDDLPILSDPAAMFDDMVHNSLCNNGTNVNALKPLLQTLHGRSLKIATMCSGTESPVLALDMIKDAMDEVCQHYNLTIKDVDGQDVAPTIQLEHVFSCEIEPFKQAYIQRNFQPKRLFRDIRELGNDQAHTAYGGKLDVPNTPGCVDLLVAGTSCVDFSNLNNSKVRSLAVAGISCGVVCVDPLLCSLISLL